jgi:hypothetical protein
MVTCNIHGILSLVLLLLWIQVLGNTDVILGCGLFAFIGTNPQECFNWDKFNILGILNDDRGGDACGRVYSNVCEHGTGLEKKYQDFLVDNKSPLGTSDINTVLGHCRKASSGGKDAIYAQPIILMKRDINMKAIKDAPLKRLIKAAADNDIIFSGIHNGTIDNYRDLAQKYGIPIEDHNDSKVILSILFYGEHKVLTEYIGTAAMIWHNHIYNKTYIFKGASKYWNTSESNTIERPLFCWTVDKDNFYLSSTEDSLKIIGGYDEEVLEIRPNTLYIFRDGKSIKSMLFSRSKMCQSKTYYNDTTDYKKNKNKNKSLAIWGGTTDDLDEGVYYEGRPFHAPASPPRLISSSPLAILPAGDEVLIGERFIRKFYSSTPAIRIQAEKTSVYSKTVRRAIYNKTRYWMNGNLMHGVYVLSPGGCIPVGSTREAVLTKVYYFVEGMMLDGITGYRKAIERHGEFVKDIKDNFVDIRYLERSFIEDTVKYSRYPVAPLLSTNGDQDCLECMSSRVERELYCGDFTPLFSEYRYTFDGGRLMSIVDTRSNKLPVHTADDLKFCTWYLSTYSKDGISGTEFAIGYKMYTYPLVTNPVSIFQFTILSTYNLEDTVENEIRLFIVHYIRDFDSVMRGDCKFCASEKGQVFHNCTTCSKLNQSLKNISNDIKYELFY